MLNLQQKYRYIFGSKNYYQFKLEDYENLDIFQKISITDADFQLLFKLIWRYEQSQSPSSGANQVHKTLASMSLMAFDRR
ncbi:MAG TPA: hypothetical protein DGB85_02065 [Deltaproteobacteria bacterium]|nr:hypothetical protein [Deltaproteobacteria bacterium]|tara:strand:+ start:606 stop:845 length:240 start_codon:yes stop_codon:yes gene_type:complete